MKEHDLPQLTSHRTIQWFPGHMAKTLRLIRESSKQIDIILEIVDARAPIASRNPELQSLFPEKHRLLILNKSDLADPKVTQAWLDHFNSDTQTAISTHAFKHARQDILKAVKQIQEQLKLAHVGILVSGIPNVGKSSLINQLLNKKVHTVGDRPAVTQNLKWVKLTPQLSILDSPGVLWPKFETQEQAMKLGLINAIKDTRLFFDDLSFFILKIAQHSSSTLRTRYNLSEIPSDPLELMENIARKRGYILKGNEIDWERVQKEIVKDFRLGKLGHLSLETPYSIK